MLRVLFVSLLLALLPSLACRALRVDAYTVQNESAAPVLVKASFNDCHSAADLTRVTSNWQTAGAHQRAKFSTLGLARCVVVTYARRNIILTEKSSSDR